MTRLVLRCLLVERGLELGAGCGGLYRLPGVCGLDFVGRGGLGGTPCGSARAGDGAGKKVLGGVRRLLSPRFRAQIPAPEPKFVKLVRQSFHSVKFAVAWVEAEWARSRGDDRTYLDDLFVIADSLGQLGRWKSCEKYALRARVVASALKDDFEVAHADFQLGCAYSEQGVYDRAESAFVACLPVLRQRAPDKAAAALLLLAQGFRAQKRESDARAMYSEALTVAEAGSDRRSIAIATVQLGNIFYREGAYEMAERYYLRALEQYGALHDRRYQAETKLSLGYVAYRRGRLAESGNLAIESREYFQHSRRPELLASADELLRRLHPG